jgi:hypothetical protein
MTENMTSSASERAKGPAGNQKEEKHQKPRQPSETHIDETVEESFPASDAPSHGGVTKILGDDEKRGTK